MKERKRVLHQRAGKREGPQQVTILGSDQLMKGSEGLLLARILNRSDSEKVSENAVLFTSLLANLTPGISEVNRRTGMRIGRHLYSIISEGKNYLLYEEPVNDLIKFFEHAGYTRVTYNVFPDRIDMQMYDKSKEFIGIDLHSFEAGLVSGFMTAAKRQYVNVTEHACSNNGSDRCMFSSRYDAYKEAVQRDAKAAIHRFIDHLVRQSERAERAGEIRISPEYYHLSLSTVLERPYQEEIRHVAMYIGSQVGSRLFANRPKTGSKAAISRIERLMRTLNLGKASVKSLNPVKIDISFDQLHSRSEFVELSLALINGLLGNHAIEGARVSREARHGAYFVKITGKAAAE